MADGSTTNYAFVLPEVGASQDSWGTKLNQNWSDLDADLNSIQSAVDLKAPLASPALTGTPTAPTAATTTNTTQLATTAFVQQEITANAFTLSAAADGTLGGVQIGYVENGNNYPVELSAEKMFVNVPWTDTTYSGGSGITLNTTTFDLNSDLRAAAWIIGRDTNDYYTVNATNHSWYLDGVLDMQLTNAGTLHCDGNIVAYSTTTSSDENLKHNIEIVDNALDKLHQLNGVTFTWNKDGKDSAGLIAQDVLKVLPCAVTEVTELNGEGTHLTVNYSAVISILVESIKELAAKVEALESR